MRCQKRTQPRNAHSPPRFQKREPAFGLIAKTGAKFAMVTGNALGSAVYWGHATRRDHNNGHGGPSLATAATSPRPTTITHAPTSNASIARVEWSCMPDELARNRRL